MLLNLKNSFFKISKYKMCRFACCAMILSIIELQGRWSLLSREKNRRKIMNGVGLKMKAGGKRHPMDVQQ